MSILKKLLSPLSWLYAFLVFFRNKLFDWNILKEKEYPVTTISVGNLTVGGTGKTPHVEYLIRLLKPSYKIAVLSRGYKRKTKGFVMAGPEVRVDQIGDEPYQIYSGFPDIVVAVSESRRKGIEKLLQLEESRRPEIILLDDAFQHRYVKPGYSILLMDYNRLPYEDRMLPVGTLREPCSAKKRANMIIITKCRSGVKPMDMLVMKKELNLYPYQSVFFTTFHYPAFVPLYPDLAEQDHLSLPDAAEQCTIILVTGIAFTLPLTEKLSEMGFSVSRHFNYPDHHWYDKTDMKDIITAFNEIKEEKKFIIFTEKDAMKIRMLDIPENGIKEYMYYLPVEVEFLNNEKEDFNRLIEKYVITDKRNSIFS